MEPTITYNYPQLSRDFIIQFTKKPHKDDFSMQSSDNVMLLTFGTKIEFTEDHIYIEGPGVKVHYFRTDIRNFQAGVIE